jgi:hypothetical protein
LLEALEQKRLVLSEDMADPGHFRKLKGIGSAAYTVSTDVIKAVRAGREYRYAVYRDPSPEDFHEAADTEFWDSPLIQPFAKKRCPAAFLKANRQKPRDSHG